MLGLLVEQRGHGFELAKALEPGGWLSEVFTTRRAIVYRALKTLEGKSLLVREQTVASTRGPDRTIMSANKAGERAFHAWLETPVRHLRDVRVELLAKLAFHERLGIDAQPFITRQAGHFRPIYEALQTTPIPPDGIERQVALWRKEASKSVMRFLDEVGSAAQ